MRPLTLRRFTLLPLFWAAGLSCAASAPAPPHTAPREAPSSPVLSYQVEIRPSMTEAFVRGRALIELDPAAAAGWPVCIPRNDLEVAGFLLDGTSVPLPGNGPFIEIPRTRTAEILYTAHPRRGLEFAGGTLYSVFSTSHWMPCLDEPSVRAPLSLTLVLPTSLEAVATGRLVSCGELPAGEGASASEKLVAWRFELEEPYPSYLYGFAAGRFLRATSQHNGVELVAVGDGVSQDELRRLIEATEPMLDFFTRRACVPYPLPSYTQVVVPGYAAQEMAGLSVLGADGMADVLAAGAGGAPSAEGPPEDWLPAHELSHAWWGNRITCRSWDHFWLNEGFAVFMTAAWKEHRWGEAGYGVEMERAHARWKRARDAGADHPLAFAGRYPSMGLRNCIVYSKAAIFLDVLRQSLGEEKFWRGVCEYTRSEQGRSVVSDDFEKDMERATGADLRPLFQKWVDAPPP